jgi:L-alanine-DL-glutamate epimerase-like enolase superfamily enzyme
MAMKIVSVEDLHCGAGWRDFSFLKIVTDTGIIGYSEFLEERNIGITNVILWLGGLIVGEDPLPYEKITQRLKAITRHVSGGLAAQAIAAIENALLDIVGKHLGVPVCCLFGGPVRTELPVYWSHAGSFRLQHTAHMGIPRSGMKPITTLADVEDCGREVLESGHTALKTNIFILDAPGGPELYMPGFAGAMPELNLPFTLIDTLIEQLAALRRGAGPKMGIKLDLNYNFKPEGVIQIGRALVEAKDLIGPIDWLEYDILDPAAMRQIRQEVKIPIASLESLYGRVQFRPYLEAQAVDYAIVDVLWNGAWESIKIAALADCYQVSCAAHNYHGWLGTAISAHFCAAIPNFKVLEIDVDDVAWKDEIVTVVPAVRNGVMTLPSGPGWGVDLNEEAIRAHPAIRSPTTGIWSGPGRTLTPAAPPKPSEKDEKASS